MNFRTEIDLPAPRHIIGRHTPVLMLGSCFSDSIGGRLEIDGFDVLHNPLGPLYNPLSISSSLRRAIAGELYTGSDFVDGERGRHCLHYASRYNAPDDDTLAKMVNTDFRTVTDMLHREDFGMLIVTFGTAWVFERNGQVAGNCHKFPAGDFVRRRLDVEEIVNDWRNIILSLPESVSIIFTVSPIRHLADGLHGNQLSKATLLLAIDRLCGIFPGQAVYFPAYEIVTDDLRDYRFYAADMKHPSEVAADYIYSKFCHTYISESVLKESAAFRARYKASQHRQIL